MIDREWADYISERNPYWASGGKEESVKRLRAFRSSVLKEAAERAVKWCEQYDGFMTGNDDIELRSAIFGERKEKLDE